MNGLTQSMLCPWLSKEYELEFKFLSDTLPSCRIYLWETIPTSREIPTRSGILSLSCKNLTSASTSSFERNKLQKQKTKQKNYTESKSTEVIFITRQWTSQNTTVCVWNTSMVICFMHIFIFLQCSILHHFLSLHMDLTIHNITISGLQLLLFVCVHLITVTNQITE